MLSWFDRRIAYPLAAGRLGQPKAAAGELKAKEHLRLISHLVAITCRWVLVLALCAPGLVRTESAPLPLPPAPIVATSLDHPLSALRHTTFIGRDGAPAGVTSFAQTPDGFLWVGTHYGLYLFDGVRFQIQAGDQLQSSHIHALWADKNRDLWIGFSTGGVSAIRNGRVTNYSGGGLPPGTAFEIARTRDGTLWVATTLGLARLVAGAWRTVGADWGVGGIHPQEMHLTADGTLWLNDGQHSYRLTPKSLRFETLDLASYSVQGLGLPKSVPITNTEGVTYTLVDSSGAIWQASKTGLTRYRWPGLLSKDGTPKTETIEADDGLSGIFVFTMFEDAEGNFWLGTNGGLDRFKQNRLNVVPFGQAIFQPAMVAGDQGDIWVGNTLNTGYHVVSSVDKVSQIPPLTSMMTREPDGTIWLGAAPGLMRLKDGEVTNFDLPSDIKRLGFRAQALARQGDGSLWLSMAGSGLRRYKDGMWTSNGGLEQLPKDQNPLSMVTSADGSLYLGYPKNRLYIVAADRVKHFEASDGISVGAIQAISVRGGDTWVGGERGVDRLYGGTFEPLKGERDETFKDISGIVQTEDGDLWLNGAFGLYRIKSNDLKLLKKQPSYAVSFDHFTSLDGLSGPAVQIRPTPTLIEGSDGRLWASTEKGVVWVDPRNIRDVKVELFPVVQTIEANGVSHLASEDLTLSQGTKNLRIDYTVPVLGEPERVRFRYRLLGFDQNWQEADSRREAYFTNLAPGSYTFQLEAKMEGEGWSPQMGQSKVYISPSFYQTWWFDVLIVLFSAVILWSLHLLWMRRLATRMQIRRHERERVARDLHDTLLQSVQGLILQVHVASDYDANPLVRQRVLGDAVASAQTVLKEGRDKVMELRDDGIGSFELAELIRHFIMNAPASFIGNFNVVVEGNPTPLRTHAKDEIFSVAREMITNVWNHANASSIDVSLHYGWRSLVIRVGDNGRGIPEAVDKGGLPSGRWGILGMKERARQLGGTLTVRQGVKGGALAELRVPARRTYVRFWST
jgi:signal transduction histidine kinase/ligand-binding sensor domain-containing protein